MKARTYIPWGIKHIQAHKIWPYSKGKGIRIGVIDTGADFSHPNLIGSLSYGANMVQRHLPPFDDNGHGTHIAGTIAANGRKNGIYGTAPAATIHPVKAFDQKGTAYVADIVEALEWCIRHKMHIINMSFGMSHYSVALHNAVLKAARAGIIVVASSGNDGNRSEIDYPACFAETISVGATTRQGKIASFTNRNADVNIYAPGESIYSTWPGQQYQELSGTSMATSHVSGVIAMLMAKRKLLTSARIKRLLKRSGRTLSYRNKQRRHEIDAPAAYAQLFGSGKMKKQSALRLDDLATVSSTPRVTRKLRVR